MKIQKTEKIAATLPLTYYCCIAIISDSKDAIVYQRGNDEYVKTCFIEEKLESVSFNKIYYSVEGRAYFKKFSVRYYLDEFMLVR